MDLGVLLGPLLMAPHRQARRAHRSHAASLKAVTRLISKNAALNDLVNFHFDAENSPPPDSDEASWLDAFDLDQ